MFRPNGNRQGSTTVAGTLPGIRGWKQLTLCVWISRRRPRPVLSKAVTFAYFWLVSIKSNIFIRSTLCSNLLCSTTLSHRHVASEDSRPQESKPDEEQFQLLFLLLPCAVSVPSAFPVPFHGLCAPASDFAMWLTFLLKRDSLSFCFNKTYQKHIFAGRATRKCKRHWKRHWKGTGKGLGTDKAHGNSKNSSWNCPASLENNTRMCVCRSVGLRSPSTPSTV